MKTFWTSKRLEAVSRVCLTLFQAFLIAAAIGGAFGKISSLSIKMLYIIFVVSFLIAGLVFADQPMTANKEGS